MMRDRGDDNSVAWRPPMQYALPLAHLLHVLWCPRLGVSLNTVRVVVCTRSSCLMPHPVPWSVPCRLSYVLTNDRVLAQDASLHIFGPGHANGSNAMQLPWCVQWDVCNGVCFQQFVRAQIVSMVEMAWHQSHRYNACVSRIRSPRLEALLQQQPLARGGCTYHCGARVCPPGQADGAVHPLGVRGLCVCRMVRAIMYLSGRGHTPAKWSSPCVISVTGNGSARCALICQHNTRVSLVTAGLVHRGSTVYAATCEPGPWCLDGARCCNTAGTDSCVLCNECPAYGRVSGSCAGITPFACVPWS